MWRARRVLGALSASTAAAAASASFAAGSTQKPATSTKAVPPAVAQDPMRGATCSKGDAARWPNLVVLPQTRALIGLFTVIRDTSTSHGDFAHHADRLMRLLAEEGLAHMPDVKPKTVATPCGSYQGLQLQAPSTIAAVSIVRAGDTLLEAARALVPSLACGKILIQRDEDSPGKEPRLFYVKLPRDIGKRAVLLVDPMLATGQSAELAIRELVNRGVPQSRIVFLNVVACPEGLDHLFRCFPDVKVVTGAVDSGLNEHKYIVPGLGDYGDRYFGTEMRSSDATGENA